MPIDAWKWVCERMLVNSDGFSTTAWVNIRKNFDGIAQQSTREKFDSLARSNRYVYWSDSFTFGISCANNQIHSSIFEEEKLMRD